MADGGNATDYDMAPETTLAVVNAANAMIPTPNPPGPFQPTWDSLKENYKVPQWFAGAKFGLFMHWGLYSVPAHHNEWYEKHMYTGRTASGTLTISARRTNSATRISFRCSRNRISTPTRGRICSKNPARNSSCRRRSITKILRCGTAR
jgi:hypothetical protein